MGAEDSRGNSGLCQDREVGSGMGERNLAEEQDLLLSMSVKGWEVHSCLLWSFSSKSTSQRPPFCAALGTQGFPS